MSPCVAASRISGGFPSTIAASFGETPSQTLKRQAVFSDALSAMPAFFVSSRDRPTVALGPIDAGPEHGDIARSIADELATALNRAGAIVVRQPGAARYHLSAPSADRIGKHA